MWTKLLNVAKDVYGYVDDTMVKQEHKDKYEGKVKELSRHITSRQLSGLSSIMFSLLFLASHKYLYSGTKPIQPSRPLMSQLEMIVKEVSTEAEKYPILDHHILLCHCCIFAFKGHCSNGTWKLLMFSYVALNLLLLLKF